MSSDLCPQCFSVLKVVGEDYEDGDVNDHIDDEAGNWTDHQVNSNVYILTLACVFSFDKYFTHFHVDSNFYEQDIIADDDDDDLCEVKPSDDPLDELVLLGK